MLQYEKISYTTRRQIWQNNGGEDMTKHCRIYMKHFDYGEQDVILCEACSRKAVDIHHINGRGKDKDVIENLMALCRRCHDMAHEEKISKGGLQYIHNNFLAGRRKPFLK